MKTASREKIEAGAFALHARNSFVPWDKLTEHAKHAYRMDAKAVIDAIALVEAIDGLEEVENHEEKPKGSNR